MSKTGSPRVPSIEELKAIKAKLVKHEGDAKKIKAISAQIKREEAK